MKNFNLYRLNMEKIKLGEQPISLVKSFYQEPKIMNNQLIDQNGNPIGTKGDMYHKLIIDKILQDGFLDRDPRPHYEDFYLNAKFDEKHRIVITPDGEEIYLGKSDKVTELDDGVEVWVPAHTISVNQGVECSYDLSKGESPMITLRPIATLNGFGEILWIYQKESNDLVEYDEMLGKNTWDQDHVIHNWWKDWAIRDKDGNFILNDIGHPNIGKCYGGTTRPRHMLKREVIDSIRACPDGRRNITSLWQIDDFNELHALKPCAFLTIWNVRHDWDGKKYLDMTLIQRSSDFLVAGCINQVQYAALLKMVAKELGDDYIPGIFTWKPINIQIYDRHFDQAITLIEREPVTCAADITINPNVSSFDDLTPRDIKVENFPKELIKKKNPQLSFPLGI